jgi:N-carbamoyl-L-amino-acid hydrolase
LITIDPSRLLSDLENLRKIGECGPGVIRQAFSPADIEGRRWIAARMQDAGLDPLWDEIGNLFGLSPGDEPSILIGSHSDTQPEGGWLDGAFGVACGLEVARAAREAGLPGVSVVSFADEEGTFAPLMGSRVWLGTLSLAEIEDLKDAQGRRLGDALANFPESRNPGKVPLDRFRAFIEPHIEQGPVLDRAKEVVGVVTTIAGMRHVEIVIHGDQNHAGATPMVGRRDALQGFLKYAAALDQIYRSIASPVAVWTFGQLNVHPNAVSIIPGRVRTMLQVRDVTTEGLDAMAGAACDLAEAHNREGDIKLTARVVASLEPAHMDRGLVEALTATAAVRAPNRWRQMPSGALHDAGNVSRKLPTAMVFAPSIRGVSHCFEEDTKVEDLVFVCSLVAETVSCLLA